MEFVLNGRGRAVAYNAVTAKLVLLLGRSTRLQGGAGLVIDHGSFLVNHSHPLHSGVANGKWLTCSVLFRWHCMLPCVALCVIVSVYVGDCDVCCRKLH